MRNIHLLPLLFFLALASCKDDKEIPVPQPEPESPVPEKPETETEAEEVAFSFRYDPHPEGTESVELIVSQKDRTILLDTLIAARVHHNLTIKSADSTFDFTTVYSDPATDEYSMRTYVQVRPASWHIDERRTRTKRGETQTSSIHFSNITNKDYLNFTSKGSISWSTDWRGNVNYPDTIVIRYDRLLPTDLTYLLLPKMEKYIFAEATSQETFVDVSSALPVERQAFDLPAGIRDLTFTLMGHTKAGDYSTPLMLLFGGASADGYELLYPPSGIAEFELTVYYHDAAGNDYHYFNTGTTIPKALNLQVELPFAVTKPDFNDFEIKFTADETTAYEMLWRSERSGLSAQWTIYLPAKETAFEPKYFLENLEAMSLEGQNISDFSLTYLTSMDAKGYSFQSIHDYMNNTEAFLRMEMKQFRRITKEFF